MPEITVAALVTGPDGVLFVRGRGEAEWRLAGGLLLGTDETVEAALARELAAQLGLAVEDEPPFLETFYERRPHGETVVHNLFDLRYVERDEIVPAPDIESSWVAIHELEALAVSDWLRRALRSVFFDEAEELSLDALQRAIDAALTPAPVIIVTGPAGAGKSSVARALCARFERSAHVEVDRLRQMVRSSFASAVPGQADSNERSQQLSLARINGAAVARNFSAAGLTTVLDDVLEGPGDLNEYLDALGPGAEVYCVALLPDAVTLAARDAQRPDGDRTGARAEDLRRTIDENGETRGLRLDTSLWSVAETVDVIFERMCEARVSEEMGA